MGTPNDPRRARRWMLVVAVSADLMILALAGFVWQRDMQSPLSSDPEVVVGTPDGVAFPASPHDAPASLAPVTPVASASAPAPSPTAATPAPPAPAPPTDAPPASSAPAPAPPTEVAVPAGSDLADVTAVGEPIDTVAAFYFHAEQHQADAAYALWSERMRAEFPRQENLDGRFDTTADITIVTIYVAEQFATSAKVQVEFVETYQSGSGRTFIGWWDLVVEDDRWLLDHPNF